MPAIDSRGGLHRGAGRRRGAALNRAVVLATAVVTAFGVLAPVAPVSAYWHAGGSASGSASTGVLAAPTAVTVPATSGASVLVSWTVSTGLAPIAYYVTRSGDDGTVAACGTSAAVTIASASCTDTAVADGSFTYRSTAVYRSWTAASAPSGTVVVTAPYNGPLLGAAAGFSVLGSTTVVSTGVSTVGGDAGVSPVGTIVGFPPGIVGGSIHVTDSAAAAARAALVVAYGFAVAQAADTQFAGDLNGAVFTPGVHHSGAAMALTGSMTLDGLGDPGSTFIFQIDAALNTAAASHVLLINGASAANVFWQVNGAAGTGANSTFSGTILAAGAITVGAGSELIGRALALGAVTLADNTIRFTIALAPAVAITGGGVVVTKDVTPTISGTTDAPAGRPVVVTVAGQTLSATVQPGGIWAVTASALAAGSYPVVVKIRDAAGNSGTASQLLTVEVSPPAIALGMAASYSVLSGLNVVGTGVSHLTGDLGVSPGNSLTGFPPGTIGGTLHAGDPAAATALAALQAALTDGESRGARTQFTGDLNGRVVHTGVHHTSAAMTLTGNLTLDAEGDPAAVFLFQVDGALDTAVGSNVLLANGAQAANVYWVVRGAAGTGALSTFVGTVLAHGAITIGAGGQLSGRALSLDAITLSGNTIASP